MIALTKPTFSSQTTGVGLAILSNCLFGIIYLYSSWLKPLSGTEVFLWRMVAMWWALLALLVIGRQFGMFFAFLKKLSAKDWVILIAPTPILASQLWLFMWSPVNGQGINVSMGYFLFPLSMVAMGFLVFKERLNHLQKLAVTLAAAGVAMQFIISGTISWATLWVCGTYPIYYALRRYTKTPPLFGLMVDLNVIAPICLIIIIWQGGFWQVASSGYYVGLFVGLGIMSAIAMQTNLLASNLLPVNTFGILSYLEPALMFALSVFVLNERVSLPMLMSFGLIWMGVSVMIVNALKKF